MSDRDDERPGKTPPADGPKPAADSLPEHLRDPPTHPKPPKRTKSPRRDPRPAAEEDPTGIVYQHSVLCQTCLPYRDPGDAVREWDRTNGHVSLKLRAGETADADSGAWIPVGLPFGPKARLVLYHLNAEALRTRSPEIEVAGSLTMFVRHTLELCGDGRTIGAVKDQLTRLAAADFRVLTREEGSATVTKGAFMDQFRLWSTRRDRVAEASPHTVRLSDAYFESLITRAVPLDEHAVWSLSHNALAMDLYAWLAQRLHRIEPKGGPVLVPWPRLHEQFGAGYRELFKFRQVFKATLAQVQAVYPQARWTINERGVWLHRSEPPVGRRRRRATLLRTDGRADH